MYPHQECYSTRPIGPQVIPDSPSEEAKPQLVPVGISLPAGEFFYKIPGLL